MKIRNRKLLAILLAALFVVLLVVYFVVIRPLTAVEEDDSPAVELMDGEVAITSKTTNFYIFESIPRSSIQSIEVENEFGGYKVYRDASDNFQLDGFLGLSFNAELFASLVVTTGTPTAMMRVATDLDDAGLEEYGLLEPQASWTVTDVNGGTYTILVGDELLTEGGYYVKYEPRNAVYILSTTLADTVLQPAYALLDPILTAGMSTNDYFFVDQFSIWHGDELFININRVPEDQMKNPDGIVEDTLTYPLPENATDGATYELNTDLFFQILYNFIALQGDKVVCFMPDDAEMESFGLADPAYTIRYTFEDYEFFVFVSEQQPDGSYYAVSNLCGYAIVCQVSNEMLGFLERDAFAWISPTPFFVNITEVSRIALKGSDIDVDFRLTHGIDAEEAPTLDVEEVVSGTKIPNRDVKNFREYYKTMLNITNQEYTNLSAEDRAALMENEENVILTMTYENKNGDVCEYKFYKYIELSTGKISGGKIFVTVNGMGEFYTTNDLIEKVVNDTPRVLSGLDINAYGHN